MERCKENEIVAERFKASSREINQNLVGAVVSAQTGSRTYQVEHPGSTMKTGAFVQRRNGQTRTITGVINALSGDGGNRPGWKKKKKCSMRLLREQSVLIFLRSRRIGSHILLTGLTSILMDDDHR